VRFSKKSCKCQGFIFRKLVKPGEVINQAVTQCLPISTTNKSSHTHCSWNLIPSTDSQSPMILRVARVNNMSDRPPQMKLEWQNTDCYLEISRVYWCTSNCVLNQRSTRDRLQQELGTLYRKRISLNSHLQRQQTSYSSKQTFSLLEVRQLLELLLDYLTQQPQP